VEKDGTFVNCHGRLQRIGRVFPPLGEVREDWRVLLEMARRLDQPLTWRSPQEIFAALSMTVPRFAGLTYKDIGSQGVDLGANGGPAEAAPLASADGVAG
jgi:predicted molibdopterin-dependent oxidoreductase YjgC